MPLGADIFDSFWFQTIFRWWHVLVGIAWIGLLYYFNFVQVPSFAEFDANSRNVAIDKLASRALWWFRWAAMLTLLTGLVILGLQRGGEDNAISYGFKPDYWGTLPGTSILTGILLAVTMFLNVWLIIWPNQKKVIANARNVLAGGEADPGAAAAGRKALLASRTNAMFSIPMVFFMVWTSHGSAGYDNSTENLVYYWIIVLVIWAALEALCTGMVGGTAPGPAKWFLEQVPRVIVAGFVLWGVLYFVGWQAVLQ